MMICVGGVCVPLNLLIPFLVGVLHRYGWFKWFKQDWVTLSYWKRQYRRYNGGQVTDEDVVEKPTRSTEDKEFSANKQKIDKAAEAATGETDGDRKHQVEGMPRHRQGKSDRDLGGG